MEETQAWTMNDFNNKPPGQIDPPASAEDQLPLKTRMRQITGSATGVGADRAVRAVVCKSCLLLL
ncbi:hypothetical protein [Endozoicomonas sp. 8E]|uniref:hypothetical protein n=1 Tax=Endozoicomonas sp. 8E TaxID=3035692 RepID=UPI002938F6E6|nr:hypothetical protein [Endozoicomonas sp. 8E]WOG28295.1 hypothetical protein P6910_01195 [Endozoicomonas sp. 8E]